MKPKTADSWGRTMPASLALCYSCNSARAASEHSGLWGASKSCCFHLENDLFRVGASHRNFGTGRFGPPLEQDALWEPRLDTMYFYFPLVQLLMLKKAVFNVMHQFLALHHCTQEKGWSLYCFKLFLLFKVMKIKKSKRIHWACSHSI